MRYILFMVLAFSLVGFVGPSLTGCSGTLSKETAEACATVGEEELCGIAKMKGLMASAITNANDALEKGTITDAQNKIVHDYVEEGNKYAKAYEAGEGKIEAVVNVVEKLGLELIKLGLLE